MPNFDPAQNPDQVLPSDLITNDRFGVGAQQSFDALSASRYAPPGQVPLEVTTAAAPLPNIQQGQSFTGVPVFGAPPAAAIPPAPLSPAAVAPTTVPGAPAVAPPVAPAALPVPTSPAPRAPGGAAAPARAPAAPAAPGQLSAFDEAAKKEQAATDAAGTADQATKDEIADQTRRNNIDRQADVQKQQDDRAAQQIKIDAAQKAANTPYHEFQISTARTIVSSLGMLLGSFSYDPHHVNQAVGIYQDAIKQDFAKQQADHETLFKSAQEAVEQGRQLSSDQLQDMKEYEITRAEKLQAILAKGEALASFSKNELGKATLEKTNVGLRASLDDAAQNAALLARAQAETERHDKAQEGIERAKVGVERDRLKSDTGDKEETKQLQLAQSLTGKKAEIARNRVDGNADIVEALKNPNISGGELRQKLEQAMALNQGEGKRGVSTASLHFVAPSLVSADGTISDKFDQFFFGKSGAEMRRKIGLIAQTGLDDAKRQYVQQTKDFTESRKGLGYYKAHPDKIEEHRRVFYPDRGEQPAAPPAGNVTVVKNKDGSTSTYDASGKLIK